MAKKIGRYEIYEKIGFGAFGEVFRAHDPEVNRPVAVKILSALSDSDSLARFRREAAAAGNLHHPNIVTIYDSGENEGVPYIVMELVEGRDLQKTVAARNLSLLEKVDIMYQVAEGLQYAHVNKVVHRDIKPANIMVLPGGSVKILDFGIARFDQPHAERQTRAGYLVGTILYMSPEQFQDGVVDSLCDIWAYGVVFYELLTGKYPFEAKDNAGLMYKVTRVDPPRIGTLANDCPEALEQIVHRALARDRELRYQSLDDLQLDTLPVLLELRREHAFSIFADARSLFDAGQLDEALAAVRRVLELDPGMIEARQLRDQITRQMQQWKVRPRVEALLKNAEQEIGERRFGEAIESLESALRLQTDSGIRGRLEEARRLSEISSRSSELIAQAEREFRLQELGKALRLCAEALRLDPGYPQGQRLMDAIQQEMARGERKRRLAEALEKARGLLLIQAFDELFAVLESLRAEFPSDPQAEQLFAVAKARQEEREKRNRLNEEMHAAKTLLKERRFADAVDRLQRLRGDFSGDQQFTELLSFAEDELRRQMKDQETADLVESSRQMLEQNRFDEALKLIDRGLQKYTSDGTLIRQFQAVMAAKTAFEKAQAIQEAIERSELLRQQGRPGDALNLIEAAVSRYGTEPELLRFRTELEEERQRQERAEALRKTLRQGEEWLRQRNLRPAITLLQSALAKYPEEAELQSLLSRVMEANRQAEQRRFVEEQLGRSLQLENGGQWDAALAVVDDALQHFPDAAELKVAQARLEKKQQEAQTRKEVASYKLQLSQAAAARDWDQAARMLEEARARIPAADFADLGRQVEAARTRAGLDALVDEVQDGLVRGDLERVRELIETGLNQYGRQERLLRLGQVLERETSYRESIAAAKKALAERRLGPANEFLQKALASRPADNDALALLDIVVEERAKAERTEVLASGKEKLQRLLSDKQYDRAIECLESLLALAPEDPELRARLAEVRRAKTEAERDALEARRRAEQERMEREARLRGERETQAKAEREAIAKRERERAEREAQLRAEREAQAKAEQEAIAKRERERAERAAQQRAEQEILSTNAQIDSLLMANDLDNATRVFELTKLKHGDDARLRDAEQKLSEAAAEKQRRDEIQRLCGSGRDLMRQGRFDEALLMLESAAVRFPDADEFPKLLAEAEASRRKAQRQQTIQQALAAAAAMVEKGQAEAALSSLEDKLQEYPDSRELAEAAARLRRRVDEVKRRREIGESTEIIERHIAEGNWAQAVAEAESTQLQFPETPQFAGLKRRAEAGKRQAEIDEAIASATKLRREGNLPLAGEVVAAGRARFPDEQRLNKLFHEIEAARSEESIARAKPLIEARKYAEAETLLHEALARRPKLAAAEELLRDIAGRKTNELREQRMHADAVAWAARGDRRPRRGLIVGIVAAVVLLLAGGAWWKLRPKPTPPPAVLETWEHPTATRGEPFAATVHARGGTAPLSWSVAKGSLPGGLTMNPATGLIEGTPSVVGSYTFSAKVTDLEGRIAQREFAITVKPAVKPPIVKPVEARLVIDNASEEWTALRGRAFAATLRASGGTSAASWTVSRRSLPRGLALEPKTGRISGFPMAEGIFTFSVKASDREGHSAEGEFTITVKGKEAPLVVPSGPAVLETGVPPAAVRGERYTAALRATGGTGAFTWSLLGSLPRGLNLDAASGRIDGTPTMEGMVSFVTKVTDQAGKTGERAFTITVTVKAPKEPLPPPCVTKPFDYNTYGDVKYGALIWAGNLQTGGDLAIDVRTPSIGQIRGGSVYLPGDGAHVQVEVAPNTVKVKEAPSARNCWKPSLVLRNEGPPVSSITINWRVIP